MQYRRHLLVCMSCGPEPEEEYDFEFVFAVNGESGDKPEYFLNDLGSKTKKLTERYIRPAVAEEREELECRQQF